MSWESGQFVPVSERAAALLPAEAAEQEGPGVAEPSFSCVRNQLRPIGRRIDRNLLRAGTSYTDGFGSSGLRSSRGLLVLVDTVGEIA